MAGDGQKQIKKTRPRPEINLTDDNWTEDSKASMKNNQSFNLPGPNQNQMAFDERQNWFGTYSNQNLSFTDYTRSNVEVRESPPSMAPINRRGGGRLRGNSMGFHARGTANLHSSPTMHPAGSRAVDGRKFPKRSETVERRANNRVRKFDQVNPSDDELSMSTAAEFSKVKQSREATPKRQKTSNADPNEPANTKKSHLQGYQPWVPLNLTKDDFGIMERPDEEDANDLPWPATPGAGSPMAGFGYQSSKGSASKTNVTQEDPYYSPTANLNPPTPGSGGAADAAKLNAYMFKLQAARAEKAARTRGSVTTSPTRQDLLVTPEKSGADWWNSWGYASASSEKVDNGVGAVQPPSSSAPEAYNRAPTPSLHNSHSSETSPNQATQQTEKVVSPAETNTPVWTTPKTYPSPDSGSQHAATSNGRAHNSSPLPTTHTTRSHHSEVHSQEDPTELAISTENDTPISSAAVRTETPTKYDGSATEYLQDRISRNERSFGPSPPILEDNETQSMELDKSSSSSELSDPPSEAGSDPFEDIKQATKKHGEGKKDNDKETLSSSESSYSGMFNITKAFTLAKKDSHFEHTNILFNAVPKSISLQVIANDEEVLQTSLEKKSRWIRPLSDNIKQVIPPDPHSSEMAEVLSEVEQLILAIWVAVESIVIVYFAEFGDNFNKRILEEESRRWQLEIYCKYELLVPFLVTINGWRETYFEMCNIKKRSWRFERANPYRCLFEKNTTAPEFSYGSFTYLAALQNAIAAARDAYKMACMKGPKFKSLIGKDRRTLGAEYESYLGSLRQFNKVIVTRDWKIQSTASSPTQQISNNVTPESATPEQNGITDPDVEENNISSSAVGPASIEDDEVGSGYWEQLARPRGYAAPPAPNSDVPQLTLQSLPNREERAKNEARHRSVEKYVSDARDEIGTLVRGRAASQDGLAQAPRKKIPLQVDVSSSVGDSAMNEDEYYETS